MNKLAPCLLAALVLFACSNAGLSTYDKESRAIYKALVERAERYDQEKIPVFYQPGFSAIDRNNFPMIKRGLKTYNDEVQKAIDSYNSQGNGDFLKELGGLRVATKGDIAYQLSKVGFDGAFEYAVVFEKDLLKPELSHTSFIFLRKRDGQWGIDSEVMEQ